MSRLRAGFVMFKFAISSLITVFCAVAAAQAAAQGTHVNSPSLESLYDAAQQSQKAGNLNQAAGDYQVFLAAALDELGNSHAQIGDYAKAATLFDEALALSPDSAPVHRDYATWELQASDLKRAETLARELLSEVSSDPKGLAQAHEILGRTLHRMNRDQEARKELEAAAALDASVQNEYDLAVVCLDLDDDGCAVKIFDGLETSLGDSPRLHMQFGLAYGNSDFTPRAVTEFKKVIAEDPHYPGAHYCVAAALLAAGEDEKTLQEAEAELKEELAISPNDFLTYAALGKIESSYHRYTEAERYLKRAIVLNPRNPDAYLYLGQMYFDLNRLPEAETNLHSAIELTTDITRNHYQIQKAHFLLGRILMQEHHPDRAHAEMQIAHDFADKALSKDKNKLAGLLDDKPTGGGQANAQVDATSMTAPSPHAADPVAAGKQRAFEKQLTPVIADGYNNLGAIAATESNYTGALKYFEHAAIWNPSSEGLDYNMGRAAFMASKFSEAVPPLSRYVRLHPGDSGIRGALAMSQFMTHNYSGCLEALRGAGDSITSIPQMQYIYAESLVKTGQVAPGKARLLKLEAAHPEIAEVHRGLGEIAEHEGDRQNAIKELEEANGLNGSDPETHYDLGKADLESGSTPDAILELETAVRLQPDEASFHRELASAYERAFRMSDAEKERHIAEQIQAVRAPNPNGGVAAGDKATNQ
jgi:tetratricopeptide (TPR) repeat protein